MVPDRLYRTSLKTGSRSQKLSQTVNNELSLKLAAGAKTVPDRLKRTSLTLPSKLAPGAKTVPDRL